MVVLTRCLREPDDPVLSLWERRNSVVNGLRVKEKYNWCQSEEETQIYLDI